MKKLLSCFALVASITHISAHAIVEKLSDDLYTGGVDNKPGLRVVMERVNEHNKDLWYRYATVQSNPRVSVYAQKFNQTQKGRLITGSGHFSLVLEEVSYTANEIWVAYITADSEARSIVGALSPTYGPKDIDNLNPGSFASNIKMFVSVTSSPDALLTSHLGIAASVEATILGRPKNLSMSLHSFAAKVMLERNPARRYMVNAPAMAMAHILKDNLPEGSMFLRTREEAALLLQRQQASYHDFERDEGDKLAKQIKRGLS